jgi:hypothetical protein
MKWKQDFQTQWARALNGLRYAQVAIRPRSRSSDQVTDQLKVPKCNKKSTGRSSVMRLLSLHNPSWISDPRASNIRILTMCTVYSETKVLPSTSSSLKVEKA